jgi:aminopeptidase YwaD
MTMSRIVPVALLISCAVVLPISAQQFTPLLDPGLRDLLHETLSGEIAKDHVIQITRHHRIQGSRGYRDAANYVLDQLERYGFSEADAYIESCPSDGRVAYQTWQSPSGWDVESAELRMVEPYQERIVGYPEIAMSLITYSNAGDVTAELVWVGGGTSDSDYEGKDVRNKFVLATGYGGDVHRLAVVKYGAAGVVAYLDDDRAREHPDMLQYTGMWPLTEELEQVTFGFNLTNRQGERLLSMLQAGRRVVLHGSVVGIGLESYFMDVVVARIPGSEREGETLVFSAHLDHPKESANDNASGSAAQIDIARTLRALIDAGRLPQPKRTLLFLWVPEWNGTMAYVDGHPEMVGPALGGRVLANLNLDMVGEDLELLHSAMGITRTPASLPSALNDVVENMAAMVDRVNVRTPRGSLSRFNYRVTPYSGGSDHMMFIDRKVPGMMIGHSDYTHHTSEDTPDKVDPVELERSELIATAALLYLSDLTEDQALDLVHEVGANGTGRLAATARRVRREMLNTADARRATAWFEAQNALTHAGIWEREAVRSVLTFNGSSAVREIVERVEAGFGRQQRTLLEALRADARAADIPIRDRSGSEDSRVPHRLTRGPLDFGLPESQLSADAAAWYRSSEFVLSGAARFELVNFIDGERTVTEIRDALSAEFGPVSASVVARYLEDLARVGVIAWE